MTVTPFTDSDWDGFGGATSWDNGDQPLIGEDGTRVVIFDKNGADVLFDGVDDYLRLDMPFSTQAAAIAFANGLPENFDALKYGFVN